MSSLSVTQANGYYVPPEYYSSGQYKNKPLHQFNGSKGHNLQRGGVVRFELSYNGFCIPCGAFNAVKSKTGSYRPEFRMECRICCAAVVIRTNPKDQGFDYVSGIHKKQVQEFDTVEDTKNGNRLVGNTDRNNLSHLETVANNGKRKAATTEREAIETLIKVNKKTFGEDVSNNAIIRTSFRKYRKKARLKGAKLGWAEGMEVLKGDLLEDVVAAKSTTFSDGRKTERKKLRRLRAASIFGTKRRIGPTATADDVPSQELGRDSSWGEQRLSIVKQEPTPDYIASLERRNTSVLPTPITTSSKQTNKKLLLTPAISVAESALDMLAGYDSD